MHKLLDTSTCKPFNIIFKSCLTHDIFPSEQNKANVEPIHKKKKRRVENYRPVSLLSICGKVFERIIYNTMFPYFVNVFFRLHQICIRQKRENYIFLLNFIFFWNFSSIFLPKDKIIVFYTLKYFWSTAESKGRQIKRIMFCFICCFYLKILTSKRFNMQLQSLFVPNLLGALEEGGRRHSLFNSKKNWTNNIRSQQFIFVSFLHLQQYI